jgi:general secretion pathway protein L
LPRLGIAGLAGLAAALAATAAFLPIYQAHRTADALAAELATARHEAEESLGLQKAIDAEIQESGFLATRKREAPAVSDILFRMTRILPDDSWLTELQFANPDVQITGLAASASTILGLLDQSPGFTNATFRSSVMQDQRSGHEQFNIGVRVQRPKTP